MSTTINLQAWCGDSNRFDLSKPFVLRGFLYATDGRRIIRIPSGEPDTVTDKRFPLAYEIFSPMPSNASLYQPWPEANYSECERECLECKGKGRINTHPCTYCEGEGEVECETCHHETECVHCDGTGECNGSRCKACNGKKVVLRPWQQKIGEAWIDADFDMAVRELPNPAWWCKDADSPVFIRFDGGEAIVMPFGR